MQSDPSKPERLTIVHYPAAVLRAKALPIVRITDEVRAVARRMIEIMHEEQGIGLAAPQVGLSWRMFVVQIPASENHPLATKPEASGAAPHNPPAEWTDGPVVYVNPVLSRPLGPAAPYEEGCLSLPEIRGDVLRPPRITLTATNLEGDRFSVEGGGLLARCWQHELDHLDGVLIIDRMTQMSRIKNRAAVRDLERSAR